MKTKYLLPAMVMALGAVTGCATKESAPKAGIDLANMDTTFLPGKDFYQYACGGWIANHPLTDEYASYGVFNELDETNRTRLKGLIADIAAQPNNAPGSIAQKIGDLYTLAMDSAKLNADGMAPIKPQLEKIAAISKKEDIVPMIGELLHSGISTYFYCYVGADIKDSKMNLFQLYQGGINLGEKEYYLDTDSVTTDIRDKYKQHIVNTFQLAGYAPEEAQSKMEAVMEIETAIAKASFSAVEQRDPAANYHKMSLDELKKLIPGIDWDLYLKSVGANGVAELSVSQIEPIKEVEKLINTLPVDKH
ncbi:MAG: M13 family metallopeptidase N-terminal domain-containing protein, partial [Phocaeicola sp.]|nr:M13 family metallopeptidase N-terminal domain-containing protein [Phocaeicola sp.]